MPAARTRAAEWQPPADPQLVVLRTQIASSIEDGERLRNGEHDSARWTAWEIHLEDLLLRALGDRWRLDFRAARGDAFRIVSTDEEVEDLLSGGRAAITRETEAKLAVARMALKGIDQELERRGALPTESGLPTRDFGFVSSEALRAVASRDYEELRAIASHTVKARGLLAGAIVEAVLSDALQRNGFTARQLDDMRFVQLIDEAATANIIQSRTRNAAHAVRDVRNFVHPAVELREGRLRKVDADAAVALMQMVLEDVS